MRKITGQVIISDSFHKKIETKVKNIFELKERVNKISSEKTSEILETILAGSINLRASDIHIEPQKKQTKIRLRVDGVLEDAVFIDLKIYKSILSRIKLLSKVKLNITSRPQDGRFSIIITNRAIEVRTSVIPTERGESVVMRLLDPKKIIEIEGLGLRKDLLGVFKNEIKRPNGMIIVTGPTGSGKTTTLYAFLKRIQNPKIKVITVEDPIEYHIKGITQTQIAPDENYNFANGLRSIVRQDPDVILVGEIRDLETVKIAIQAALTGHLVLTTVHTNDAAGTIARLISLGANPANIGPAINMAIAQRLVRKICKKCGQLEKPSSEDLKKIKKGLRGLPKNIEIPKISPKLKIFKPKGCKNCNFTGYHGRIGIFESFLIDNEMERFIIKSPSIASIRKEAAKRKMTNMRQDGLIKVLQGLTTIEEVERITGPIK
ncbi:MAG: GspE/PulE family protein [Patescibacteria group bacterium]|nr:GspE/PulE family protein [Patescibacteria group bacterium]